MTEISRRAALQQGLAFALVPPMLGGAELMAQQAAPSTAPDATKTTTKAPAKDPYADAVFVKGEPAAPADGSFTVIVLPDTQHYSEKHPDNYHAQTKWIVENVKKRNIACVLHLGDITNHNTPEQWEVARAAMQRLDGHVPYFMVCGNHDYGALGRCGDRTTHYNEYFPLAKYKSLPTFGGVYDKEPERYENSYHLFSAGGRDFVVIGLEFGPRADVVRWANEVAAKHRDRQAILITHAYMYFDETRYDWKKHGKNQKWNPHGYAVAAATQDDVNDGEELWGKLVGKNENFICTLNGHVLEDGLGRITTSTAAGRNVPQMLVNFQMKPNGGDGWLRVMEFKADRQTVDIVDYSPTRGERNESAQNKFTIQVAPVKA